ncbi:hypothetical protein D9M68_689140 [compost metagenome]
MAVGHIDNTGGAHQRVAADVHGRCAGVVGLPFHSDLHAADADDIGHHADRQLAAFQHGALFDMQFDEGGGLAGAAQRRIQRRRVAADAGNALGQGFALRVARRQHGGVQLAAERAAADARRTIVAGLFGQKVDHLEWMFKLNAVFAQAVSDFNTGQHADDAVKAAAAHDRIAMRAGADGLAGRVPPGQRADQVAAGVQARGEARGLELLAQPGTGLGELGRKGAACPGNIRQGKAGQRFDARPQAFRVQGREFNGHGSAPQAWRGRRKRPSPFWLTMRWPSNTN